jgi:diguanylate cyclase (GGDEF)-like protein
MKALLYYDHLTGLSNRRKLIERLPDFLEDATSKGKALLFIDIDNIKLINDTMGHSFGDSLIAETAKRLTFHSRSLRTKCTGSGRRVHHPDQIQPDNALREKSAEILNLSRRPFTIEKSLIHSTISIGISLYPMHSTDPGELLKCAIRDVSGEKRRKEHDGALHNNMMTPINDRMSIGEYLHDALENNELEVLPAGRSA